MSSSFFVSIAIRICVWVNSLYEKSFFHKVILKIAELSENSVVVNFFVRLVTVSNADAHKDNSIFINAVDKVLRFIYRLLSGVFDYFVKVSEYSLFTNIAKNLVMPMKNLGILFNSVLILGGFFFIGRLALLTVRFGFSVSVIAINGVLAIGMLVLSFINFEKLEAMVKNNVIAKLLVWFFIE